MDGLPFELRMLAWAILLGLVQIFLAAGAATAQRGLAWNASNRDRETSSLGGVAGRLDRALRNFLETFPFFAAAVLAVVLADRTDAGTALGAQIYLWARVAYVAVYAAGIPYLRSLIWAAGVLGLLKIWWGLL